VEVAICRSFVLARAAFAAAIAEKPALTQIKGFKALFL
jgi:hypothetical protein